MAQFVQSNFPQLLFPYKPNILKAFGEYDPQDTLYTKIFEVGDTDHQAVVRIMVGQMGLLSELQESQAPVYDSTRQEGQVIYLRRDLGKAVMFSEQLLEAIESNPEVITRQKGEELKRLAEYSVEVIAHDFLNSCTSTSSGLNPTRPGASNSPLVGADGVALVSASHPTASGNQSNVITGNPSFSESALETAAIQVRTMTNSAGQLILAKIKAGVVPPQLMFEKERLLKSINRPHTANNEINAIRETDVIPDMIVSPFLTSTTRFFLLTDIDGGLELLWRKRPVLSMDNDFETDGMKAKIKMALMAGFCDWRGVFSSSG